MLNKRLWDSGASEILQARFFAFCRRRIRFILAIQITLCHAVVFCIHLFADVSYQCVSIGVV